MNIIFRLTRNRYNFNYRNLKQFIFLINFIHLIFFISFTEERQRNLINFSSEINLVISGSGNQKLLNDSFYLEPSKILVNGIKKDSCKKSCELEDGENNVILIFDDIP